MMYANSSIQSTLYLNNLFFQAYCSLQVFPKKLTFYVRNVSQIYFHTPFITCGYKRKGAIKVIRAFFKKAKHA